MTDTTFDRSVLGSEAARLLEALLETVGDTGQAQVSTPVLLKASGLTQGAFVRARTELTRHGLLRSEPGFSANGLRGANVYTLNLAALGVTSSAVSGGESIQNRTSSGPVVPSPADPATSPASKGDDATKTGFFSRLFRRSKVS